MDIIIIVLVTFVVLILTSLYLLNQKEKKKAKVETEVEPAAEVQPRQGLRNARIQANRNRLRNRIQARNAANADELDEVDDEEENNIQPPNRNNDSDDGEEDEEPEYGNKDELRKRVGTKKLAKMEEKAARKEKNEQMLRERDERKAKEEQMYEERKKREEEEERLEKEREEKERIAREEQEKKEYEEYLKLKEQFTVEEEGQEAILSEQESQNLLQEFVDYIKKSKIVVLEDLAGEFKLKTQDVINRINQVQEMGLLTGVMDDRGKFIYISEDELVKVKKFIEQRGRVNIAELAKSSNQLINLKPAIDENMPIESSA